MDLRLLEKFFKKECTPEEVAEVLRWFNAREEEPNTLSAIEEYWQQFENTEHTRQPGEVNAQLENIHHYLINQEAPSQRVYSGNVTDKRSIFRNFGFVFRVAAIITLAILASVTWQNLSAFKSDAIQQVAYITKSNPAGQKTNILLEDGSKVILNAASTLTYPEHFSDKTRTLQLQGEAFFEVAEDADRPFTVVAGNIATTALGTSFNIRAYQDENNVSVALATGKVKIADTTSTHEHVYELLPGEALTYDTDLATYQKALFDSKEQLSWKDGTIYFHDASFTQVISKLTQWYGVNFDHKNQPDQSWKYTGEFHKENLENVLNSISYAKKFDFEIHDNTVTLVFH